MTDRYLNYEQLAMVEREGRDYSVKCHDRNSELILLGYHAGGIEPGTSEIIKSIAGSDLSYYLFEGIKANNNGDLHITSTNFDEPRALRMLRGCNKAIAFHGELSDRVKVYLGGLDEALLRNIQYCLNESGFEIARHENQKIQGASPENICNKCRFRAGVQLELSRGLREQFFQSLRFTGRRQPTENFYQFIRAIRTGIRHVNLC